MPKTTTVYTICFQIFFGYNSIQMIHAHLPILKKIHVLRIVKPLIIFSYHRIGAFFGVPFGQQSVGIYQLGHPIFDKSGAMVFNQEISGNLLAIGHASQNIQNQMPLFTNHFCARRGPKKMFGIAKFIGLVAAGAAPMQ